MDDDTEHKKAKGTKNCVIKKELIFKNYTDYLLNNKNILRSQQRLKCLSQLSKLSQCIY